MSITPELYRKPTKLPKDDIYYIGITFLSQMQKLWRRSSLFNSSCKKSIDRWGSIQLAALLHDGSRIGSGRKRTPRLRTDGLVFMMMPENDIRGSLSQSYLIRTIYYDDLGLRQIEFETNVLAAVIKEDWL